jgi:hypothetical protein
MSYRMTIMAALFAASGCGGQVAGGGTGEAGESLSSYTQRLNDAYVNTDGKGPYLRIALKDDATYVALTKSGQERGTWSVQKPFFGPGQLTITPTEPAGAVAHYETSLSWLGGHLKLTSGKTTACYDVLEHGYCGIDTDCNGIPFDKQSLTCGDGQYDGNLCNADATCGNACVDAGPPPSDPPPDSGIVPPPPGPHSG